MTNTEMIGNQFYQALGKLFYAVAFADRKVREKEVTALKEDTHKYWLELDNLKDECGSDAAYQIEIVFDWLESTTQDSDALFREFSEFYRDHPHCFTKRIKSLVLRTANDIAGSFAGKNKSELILLAKLSNLFNQSTAPAV